MITRSNLPILKIYAEDDEEKFSIVLFPQFSPIIKLKKNTLNG